MRNGVGTERRIPRKKIYNFPLKQRRSRVLKKEKKVILLETLVFLHIVKDTMVFFAFFFRKRKNNKNLCKMCPGISKKSCGGY